MAVDTSIWVASIASAGVILSGVIQGSLSRSLARRADAARIDERDQDRHRRNEDRENERLVREEERSDALRRRKAEAEASEATERRSAENQVKARMQNAANQFVKQAEKCLLAQQLLKPVADTDWGDLGAKLGDVTSAFDREDSDGARHVVGCLREASLATVSGTRLAALDQAELSLTLFSHEARQASC